DHLGTPMELTDPHGNIAWAGQYKAWGEVREERSEWARQHGLGNPIRFQGQYHDHETGLHYNRYRCYDPRAGRYMCQDPIGYSGGLNLFEYAISPIAWVDPYGLSSDTICNLKCGSSSDLTGNNWRLAPGKDSDLRGATRTYRDGLDEAFKKTGVPRSQFVVTKWGKDLNGKFIPVEWEARGGANVNMDIPAWNNVKSNGSLGEGPHAPHIGYQTPRKPRTRGHIFVDKVPATRN
uniref:RHS repeat-associated core domain-containing protein n=1 Tax=Pseudomonas taiwanensis TaxID=470150 RepID=UPI001AE0283E